MLNEDEAFTTILSLGGLCQAAYQIEHRFGFRINSPFDWLVTPLASIEKILRDDGAMLGKSIQVHNYGTSAVCNHYGVGYQHDFPRNAERRIMIDAETLSRCRSKMLYKYDRFQQLLSVPRKVLFVRMGGHHESARAEPYLADPRPLTTADVNALCTTLANRFPAITFTLAVAVLPKFTQVAIDAATLDPRVKLFELLNDAGPHWQGKIESWKPLFDSFNFNLNSSEDMARQFVGKAEMYERLNP